MGDRDISAEGVIERRRHGVRYITDERLGEGTVAPFSVATNLVLKEIGTPPLWQRGFSLWDRIHRHAREQIRQHDIRTPSERTPVGRFASRRNCPDALPRTVTLPWTSSPQW